MVAVRVTRLHAGSIAPSVRVTRLHAQAAQANPNPGTGLVSVRVTRLHALAGPPLTGLVPRAGADQTVEGFNTVTLDGSTSVGATTLSWAQTSGTPTVPLGGSGAVRTFTAPTVAAGATLTFQLTATGSAGTAVDTVDIIVRPWLHWRWTGTAAVPERMIFFGGTGTVTLADYSNTYGNTY